MKKALLLAILLYVSSNALSQTWVRIPDTLHLNFNTSWFSILHPDTGVIAGAMPVRLEPPAPYVFNTTNGGTTLNQNPLSNAAPLAGCKSFYFTDENTGYVAGGGIAKTYDGGNNWYNILDYFTVGGTIYDLVFASPVKGYGVGEYVFGGTPEGDLYKTTDAGATWTQSTISFDAAPLTSVVHAAPNLLYVGASMASVDSPTVFVSSDDGNSWSPSSFTKNVYSLAFVSSRVGYAASDSGIYLTKDSAKTWNLILNSTAPLNCIRIKGGFGFAVGSDGSIYQTIDNGKTWNAVVSPVQGIANLTNVFIVSSRVAYAVGLDGVILKYTSPSGSGLVSSFRTFTYDSLALAVDAKGNHKPILTKPYANRFAVSFKNDSTLGATSLSVDFGKAPILTNLTSSWPGVITSGNKGLHIDIAFDAPLASGSAVVISGTSAKGSAQKIKSWNWIFEDLSVSKPNKNVVWISNSLILQMPNSINVLQLVGNGLKVGLGGAHSVLSTSYKDVIKSIVVSRDLTHTGLPRSLDKFSNGKSIKTQQKNLSPLVHNNRLFAEAIGLQTNLRASVMGITPSGLGSLVYDEGTGSLLPLNGMTIIEIATLLDKFMSSYNDTALIPGSVMPLEWSGLSVDTLYDRIRKINQSFSGPLDTLSFGSGLVFTGVRDLSDVPFLLFSPLAAQRVEQLLKNLKASINEIPVDYVLSQNYPNPFNPTTTFEVYLPVKSYVTLKVFNMLGQEVASLADREEVEEGNQKFTFNGSDLSSGVYFYRLIAEGISNDGSTGQAFTSIKKMVLMK
jgi:photosystem II stability/assembly factor-like uncharacterized protein